MATFRKASAIFFLVSSVCVVSGQIPNGAINPADEDIQLTPPKKTIVNTVPLALNYPAEFAVPIMYTSQDYNGPYDPLDPQGLIAASRRQAKINGQKNLETVKSYIPPDLGKVVKRGFIQVAVNEGKRFAFAHPKETAEIVGIATKAKALYDTASQKVKVARKQEQKEQKQEIIQSLKSKRFISKFL